MFCFSPICDGWFDNTLLKIRCVGHKILKIQLISRGRSCAYPLVVARTPTRGAPTFAKIDVLVGVGLVPTLIPWGVQLSNLASTVVGVSQLQNNLCIDRNC